MSLPKAYYQLVAAFDELPGVGQQAAERMAQYLVNQHKLAEFSTVLEQATQTLKRCTQCQSFSTETLCEDCLHNDSSHLLVLENLAQLEQAKQLGFVGRFFVLHGLLSPLSGRGPKALGLAQLAQLLESSNINEITLALENSAEGQATTQFIQTMVATANVIVKRQTFEQWTADFYEKA